jgi:hypothetical protein
MNKTSKNFLLTSALSVGVIVAIGILAFGSVAEPNEFGLYSVLFAIVVGIAFSAPLWLPAVIPSRYKITSLIFRWLSAVALIYPIQLFGSSLLNFIERYINDSGPSLAGLAVGVIPTTFCVIGMGLLIWPELSKLLPNQSIKRV